ncbi:hypothetical protein BS78_03G165700 [Paspalum vaginatum]|nr:hypothetical protein BS78_03G165700 [Paspalum vaginatum]
MPHGFMAAGGAASAWDLATGETAARVCSRMAGPAAWPRKGRRPCSSHRGGGGGHDGGLPHPGAGTVQAGGGRRLPAARASAPLAMAQAPPPRCTRPSSVPHCKNEADLIDLEAVRLVMVGACLMDLMAVGSAMRLHRAR